MRQFHAVGLWSLCQKMSLRVHPAPPQHICFLDPCSESLLYLRRADDAKSLSAQIRQMGVETLVEGQRPTGRVEVLPVQWRKHLKLEVRGPAMCITSK